MSTKTITKRVALATVVALGAGVLSLVTVTSANAAVLPHGANVAVGGGVTVSDNGTNSTLGLQGTVGVTTTGTNVVGGVATTPDIITATVLTTGGLSFTAGTGGLIYGGYYTVSAGGYFTADTNTAANIGGGQTTDSATAVTGVSRVITVAFNGAAGSTVTINGYDTSAKGNLATTLIVTLAGSSVAGVPSVAKDAIYWSGVKGTSAITSDLSTGSATTTGLPLALQVNLNDAYGSALTSANTGALTVTASSGANVSIGSSTGGSYSTAVATDGRATWALITEATAGAGWSGSVTVSFNGVVLATKSGTISGLPAKIVATPLVIGHTNATIDSAVSYQAYDAAGNVTVIPVAQVALSSSDNTAAVTAIAAAGNEIGRASCRERV